MDLLSFAYPFYERGPTWQITRSPLKTPRHVAIILKETDLLDFDGMERGASLITTLRRFKVEYVSVYVDIQKAGPSVENGNHINAQDPVGREFLQPPRRYRLDNIWP